ncbi:Gamma-glutamylputrescine oxidoreductase [Komagataeibacter saccharivorans]|uniref:Gamma-glutamylputrescine oxidoreductase n=1 Tax=Komagataeibacter saccharivorans TaxID=265959 RepID=A0A347WEB8_9PROT|nr:FAD-binding oxidoreductase [Komagataeibacter saccharivorans]AXY23211.1 Gamma-glutamylputrescine oxidoreductase [Komagataeibacter saccharivorans]
MAPSAERPLWQGSATLDIPHGRGRQQAETVVIGGGIAGLSTAFHLARNGHDVAVLNAGTALGLATRASAGIITGQLVRNTPASIMKRLGKAEGSRLLEAVAASPRETFALIREQNLACGAMPNGFLAPFFGNGQRERQTVADWQAWRQDMSLLDAKQTAQLTGCQGYAGAILDRSGGGVNPAAYADELARRILEEGGRVFNNCRVTSVTRDKGNGAARWLVSFPGGEFVARNVILAANGGNQFLHRALRHAVLPLPVLEVATAPVSPALRKVILPQRHALTDLATDVFSIRFDTEGHLITAAPAPEHFDWARIEDSINDRLEKAIPGWERLPLEFAWTGTAWLRSDCVPRMPILDEGLLAIQACNGRGLAINTLAGSDAANWILSAGRDLPRLPTSRPRAVPGFMLLRHVPRLIMTAARLRARVTQMIKRPAA